MRKVQDYLKVVLIYLIIYIVKIITLAVLLSKSDDTRVLISKLAIPEVSLAFDLHRGAYYIQHTESHSTIQAHIFRIINFYNLLNIPINE